MGEVFDYVSVEMWLRALLAGRFHDVVFTNAEGVLRLASLATRLGVSSELRLVLEGLRKISLGCEPTWALAKLALAPDLIITGVDREEIGMVGTITQRRMGLILGRGQQDRKVLSLLEETGAQVHVAALFRSVGVRERRRSAPE
jgi:hypothetical protein